jgi:putative peptidoglycan lipid II flippase
MVLGAPMIAVALQRGQFSAIHTGRAAEVLWGYSWGLFSVGAYTFMQRVFYAAGNYRVPISIAAFTLMTDIALSLWLKETPLRVAGLSVANSIAFSIGLVLFILILNRRVASIELPSLTRTAILAAGTSIVAGLSIYGIERSGVIPGFTGTWWREGSTIPNLGRLVLLSFVGIAVVYGIYRIAGIRVNTIIRNRRRSDNG